MYELSRVLLKSVGPPGARYQDVLLDFSGVGRPVAGTQLAIFGSGAPARRPSPATVLFLENGGGKSVLIKLIFSVVLPGRRQVVGSAGSGVLERFVLDRDTAHVVLEWTHARSGRRLITGKVSEWKDQRQTSDPRNLIERWYHFRPTANLGMENLPIASSNHYLRLASYLGELKQADADDPTMEYDSFERHGEWTDRLAELSLDPELFRYQRSMNADEGEAAEAFSFASDAAFVNFLLGAVLPTGPAREFADLLDTYAGRLSRRSQLLLERDFVDGALEILAPLAEARSNADRARRQKTAAAREMAVLLRRLRARAEAEAEAGARLQTESKQLAADLRDQKGEHARLCTVTTELERRLAGLRLEEVTNNHQEAEEAAKLAAQVAAAWQLTPLVIRHLTAEQRLRNVRSVVEAAEAAARPALLARDRAATRLAAALDSSMRSLIQKAEAAESSAVEAGEHAEKAQAEHNEAVARAAGQDTEAEAAEKRIQEVREAMAAAVLAGLLPDDITAAEGLGTAETAAAENATALDLLEAEAEQLETDQQRAAEAVQIAEQRLAELRRALDSASGDWESATARTDLLSADPALPELLGYPGGDMEVAADALLSQLSEVHDRAVATITDLRVDEAQDERNRLALEETELLPPSAEAVRVKETLTGDGITAWTGWEYLAAIPDVDRRRALVQQLPQLTSGVLLNNPEQLDQAREVLNGRELHPIGFLPVSTTTAMAAGHAALSGVDFVVPPHPGLYDEQAADAERRMLQQRHTRRQEHLAEQAERRDSAAALSARIQEWRRDFPPGRLAQLEEHLTAARESVSESEGQVAELRAALKELITKRAAVRQAVIPVRAAQRGLDDRVHRLRVLADHESRVVGWRTTVALRREAAEREREIARAAAEQARQGRERAAGLLREADGNRASASRLAEEAALLTGEAEPHAAADQPTEPLEVLRRSYASAAETYLRASVGDQLLSDLRQAEAESAQLALELAGHPQEVLERAQQLLAGPEGADQASRELARRLAEQAAPELLNRAAELSALLANRREEYERFAEPAEEIDLTPFERPRHIPHGLRLIEEAKQTRAEALRTVLDLEGHSSRLERALAETSTLQQAFERFGADWPEFADADPAELIEAEPFEPDLAVAQALHQATRNAHTDARKLAGAAEDAERKHADRLAKHASQPRFLALETASHQIVVNTDRAALPGFAADWADAMRSRLRSLTDDLAAIERHRTQIVRQFAQQVSEALQVLRRAERFSRLPKGLGGWSGERFLKIRYREVNEAGLRDRMGVLVDELAAETVEAAAAGRELKRDGIPLILKGVTNAVAPDGFKVTILKPDAVLRTERVPVSDLRAVFSGGQTLTTAIILYCTMAALRANDRGRVGNHHSGTLFLDNPIGRASAGYLLRLQQSVARALGVQLIYTTGLFDTTALDMFPLVVRLRNDADLRAKRKYLSVAEVFGRYLDESLNRFDQPQLTATRYFLKDKSNEGDDELG
ncbi:hypothetical protein [Streptomyces sp. FH025]|uniref:hypothetical protein n=1 Tax=Streptomyces sp. FH025 TaxID=2815937 RepID=UPI001A9D48B8|nr:hypothetical protein [Streptomyces sp. FH025]MBO1415674.1 hypothetical protein [Streptomyces sp. FH025]